MSYYDNVKDSVKDEKKEAKSSSNGGGGGGSGNFSTLKEEAEKNVNKDESDDTPIEVLEEGGLSSGSSSTGAQSSSGSGSSGNPMTQSSGSSAGSQVENIDSSGIEEKLDKIIEQNARMIEVLESFGQ